VEAGVRHGLVVLVSGAGAVLASRRAPACDFGAGVSGGGWVVTESRHGRPCTAGPDGGPCTRCAGFTGDEAVTHGATSTRRVNERAEEIVVRLRRVAPIASDSDEAALLLAARMLARVELVYGWLDEVGLLDERGEPRPALNRLAEWEVSAAKLLDRLGMTPGARARLGLQLARTGRALSATDAERFIQVVFDAAASLLPPGSTHSFKRELLERLAVAEGVPPERLLRGSGVEADREDSGVEG
jgi:hypothetical protein